MLSTPFWLTPQHVIISVNIKKLLKGSLRDFSFSVRGRALRKEPKYHIKDTIWEENNFEAHFSSDPLVGEIVNQILQVLIARQSQLIQTYLTSILGKFLLQSMNWMQDCDLGMSLTNIWSFLISSWFFSCLRARAALVIFLLTASMVWLFPSLWCLLWSISITLIPISCCISKHFWIFMKHSWSFIKFSKISRSLMGILRCSATVSRIWPWVIWNKKKRRKERNAKKEYLFVMLQMDVTVSLQ